MRLVIAGDGMRAFKALFAVEEDCGEYLKGRIVQGEWYGNAVALDHVSVDDADPELFVKLQGIEMAFFEALDRAKTLITERSREMVRSALDEHRCGR